MKFFLGAGLNICYRIFYQQFFRSYAGRFCAAEMSIDFAPEHRLHSKQEAIEIATALLRGFDRENKTDSSEAATRFSASAPEIKTFFKRAFVFRADKSAHNSLAARLRGGRPTEFFRALWRYIRR